MSLLLTINAMIAADCTREQIAAVVAAHEAGKAAEAEARKAAKRAGNAERQRRWRSTHNGVVTRDEALCDVTERDPLSPKEKSPTPPKEITPIPVGEANASLVAAEAGDAKVVRFDGEKKRALMEMGEWWNDLAATLGLPQIDAIKPGSTRERAAWARCREWLDDHDGIGGMTDLLAARIRGSPWLRGEKGFSLAFDWLVTAGNFQKIIEGNYENRQAQRR